MSRAPVRIGRREPGKLTFEWADGSTSEASAARLRRGCPCAHCIDEHTGAKILDPATIPEELEQKAVGLVGNYALSITFGDGHRTGIFTWDALRRLSADEVAR